MDHDFPVYGTLSLSLCVCSVQRAHTSLSLCASALSARTRLSLSLSLCVRLLSARTHLSLSLRLLSFSSARAHLSLSLCVRLLCSARTHLFFSLSLSLCVCSVSLQHAADRSSALIQLNTDIMLLL